MVPTGTTPTGEYAFTYYYQDPATGDGLLHVEQVLTPDNDFLVLFGMDRLKFDVTRFLYIAPGGDPFNPSFGNKLILLLGLPGTTRSLVYEQALTESLEMLKTLHAQDVSAGSRAITEQLWTYEIAALTLYGGMLTVGLGIGARDGATDLVGVALPLGG